MPASPLRLRAYEIIFEAETPAGRTFDIALIACIICSVAVVMLDSATPAASPYAPVLRWAEFLFTGLFTVEYLLRLWCVNHPVRYARSFYGLVDLLSILPTWLILAFPAVQFFAVLRVLRVLRVFRVLKLVQYVHEGTLILRALRASRKRITVFFFWVVTLVILFGALMYVIEGEENGFTSIPRAVYWAVVTLTTVGYGDISPKTMLGQGLASVVMILGYSIIAVPTGIITIEMARPQTAQQTVSTEVCPSCNREGHDADAVYCKYCGEKL
ncbi:ion transporter [Desulfovibrio mangrovi]|uniref:ion transporter n=1 Tax=Desulfovibrio mangrovi TaxID=2976983 RepID=UPI002247D837|nr:ion transporter [Desulfovibrio mangrovi]UZP67184.1 ion transporter [Desulfovibrio mangrovi]